MTAPSVMYDQLAQKSAEADAKMRGNRMRVCMRCVAPTDHQIPGIVHSELACKRCGVKPCFGRIVVVGVR